MTRKGEETAKNCDTFGICQKVDIYIYIFSKTAQSASQLPHFLRCARLSNNDGAGSTGMQLLRGKGPMFNWCMLWNSQLR